MTTTDLRASDVICSTDFVVGAACSAVGLGCEDGRRSSPAGTKGAKDSSTQPAISCERSVGMRKLRGRTTTFAGRLRSRGQRRPLELIRLELRVDAEIVKHVFADELAACILEDGANLEP